MSIHYASEQFLSSCHTDTPSPSVCRINKKNFKAPVQMRHLIKSLVGMDLLIKLFYLSYYSIIFIQLIKLLFVFGNSLRWLLYVCVSSCLMQINYSLLFPYYNRNYSDPISLLRRSGNVFVNIKVLTTISSTIKILPIAISVAYTT